MALNLTQKMVAFLQKNAGQKFKARDIARWVFETYPEDCHAKQKRSTAKVTPLDSDAALIQQLVAEIGSNWPQTQKRFPAIKATAGRPRFYYYTVCSDAEEVEQAENPSTPGKSLGPKYGPRQGPSAESQNTERARPLPHSIRLPAHRIGRAQQAD